MDKSAASTAPFCQKPALTALLVSARPHNAHRAIDEQERQHDKEGPHSAFSHAPTPDWRGGGNP
ncbi:MAG: hypothetical protein JSV72_17415, partial [Ralstonia sp.]